MDAERHDNRFDVHETPTRRITRPWPAVKAEQLRVCSHPEGPELFIGPMPTITNFMRLVQAALR
jgi:hypothetical protein